MIRPCTPADFDQISQIINDGAQAYRDVIPPDRCPIPYMSRDKLAHEIAAGVLFYGFEFDSPDSASTTQLAGVMGIQPISNTLQDVALIRHAYVRTAAQKHGIGAQLLAHLRTLTDRPILIGTWADATWAIRFYQRHGFHLVDPETKVRLLRTYWNVPDRQIDTSVVLADATWHTRLC